MSNLKLNAIQTEKKENKYLLILTVTHKLTSFQVNELKDTKEVKAFR
jgi:hypothetical protein